MFVVTGGGTGIGQALAFELASRHEQVLIVGRREDLLRKTAATSSLISYVCADLSLAQGREKVAKQLQAVSSLKGMVHNAGIIDPILPLEAINETSWQHILTTNLNAPLFLTQRLLKKLTQGRVLHLGSGAAYFPVAGWSGYCVSKAALSMLTRCWQLESKDIAFGIVMPGIVDTAMQTLIRQASHMTKEKQDFFQQLKSEGRLLSVQTVALFLCWLLLDISPEEFQAKEWDIYDKSHHASWLKGQHQVFAIE